MEVMDTVSDANQTSQDISTPQANQPIGPILNQDGNNDEAIQNSQGSSRADATQSSSQDSEDVMGVEDRDEDIRNAPDLRDLDNDNWQITNWFEPEATGPSNEEEDLTLLHPEAPPPGTHQGAAPNVNKLIVPICTLCNEAVPTLELLKSCGHSFCGACVGCREFLICPLCRTPKGKTCPNHVGTLMLAWKIDVAAAFGGGRWEA